MAFATFLKFNFTVKSVFFKGQNNRKGLKQENYLHY